MNGPKVPTEFLLLILSIFTLSTSGHTSSTGHIRGPHHPRSPRVEGEHSHYVPSKMSSDPPSNLIHDRKLLHDKEHLKEDAGEWLFKEGKEMSPEELEFHYFKMHDFDNNSLLDGLEILQAISHILPVSDTEIDEKGNENVREKSNPMNVIEKTIEMKKQREEDFNYYIDLIDQVLAEDDLDKDGYLSYIEYVIGRRREDDVPSNPQVSSHF